MDIAFLLHAVERPADDTTHYTPQDGNLCINILVSWIGMLMLKCGQDFGAEKHCVELLYGATGYPYLEASMHCSSVVSGSKFKVSSINVSSLRDWVSQFMQRVCVTVLPKNISCTKDFGSGLAFVEEELVPVVPLVTPAAGWLAVVSGGDVSDVLVPPFESVVRS